MPSGLTMVLRLAKTLLVLLIGMFALLVGVNNILDYESNFAFVRHVLSMDTTFPGNALRGRAITSQSLHHLAYWLIIATEILTGLLCIAGAAILVRHRTSAAATFGRAKGIAIAGLTLGFALWFFGFMTIGAEWFLMWQSDTWNGQEAAFRFIACIGVVLIFLTMRDDELTSTV